MVNSFYFHGRATKKPEYKESGEPKICKVNIAVGRDFKKEGQPDADFFRLDVFGKLAETFRDHIDKGSEIIVTGRIQNNNYTDKDGNKHYDNAFIVRTMDFCGSKGSGSVNVSDGGAQFSADGGDDFIPAGLDQTPFSTGGGDDFMNVPEIGEGDKLPF